MEALFTYFIKVNGLLLTFFLAYYFLLRKETFFNKNRWFLLLGLFASLVLPLITFTKTIWVDPSPVIYETVTTDFVPYIIENKVIEEPIDWISILFYVYLGISVVFMVKILIEILSFFRIIKFGNRTKTNEALLIDNESNANPFSFFNHIVFNRRMFTEEELQHIISHEKIHVKEKHSIDVLVSKIFCALFWANPIMWFYQKEMLQNLEYIADAKASVITQDKINYQKTLLKVVTNQHQLSITNQFYQSLIKKRIVMLNTNPSHQKNSWKYALILPVLSAFMLLFQVETVAQVKEQVAKETNYAISSNYSSILTKNTTDRELKELEETFSNENQKLAISKVKRNKKGEIIEIKLTFDSGKTYNQILERKSSEPIKDIKIYVNSDNNNTITCGFIEVDNKAAYVEVLDENAINVNGFSKTSQEYWSMDNMTKNGKEVVLIINGKIKGATEKVKIPLNEELGDMNELTPTEFEKKYNKKADPNKYYYEVETVKTVGISWDEAKKISEVQKKNTKEKKAQTGFGLTYETETYSSDENISRIKEDNSIDFKKALLLLNNKKITYEELDQIESNSIKQIISLSGNEKIIQKYGQEAKDGVIIINTETPILVNETKNKEVDFKLENNNSGFIISKNSREEDLLFYKNTLEKSDIKFSYKNIKRNSKNEIVTISLYLQRGLENIELKIKSDEPIDKYFIGTENNEIIIRKKK
ncbi:M56 family metallopeptidase [uncultured Flavobacterium sp.]|uniref:M56 family metallopeptidase n=1 Tax=uncultured Flavobacterium sp. TaxID=165435 RepID=UPI0030C88458